MKIWKHTESVSFRNPVVTIGIFDGVHTGHKSILEKVKSVARSCKGESVVLTLWPHPRQVLNKESKKLRYLSSFNEKIILLEKTGIDHLVVVEFTREFAQLGSCEFIEDMLVKKIGIQHLVIGFNHKFGRNREGDYQNLKECAEIYNFTIQQTEPVKNNGEIISSSLIRDLLINGKLDESNKYLGYNYFLQGRVTGGNRIGRQIGFPTANLTPHDEHKLIPGDGVYAVNLETDNNIYNGMLNIGMRPTIHSKLSEKTIEVNIFDFAGDLYGQDITIIFRKRIRDEKKFKSIEQLKHQLVMDREETRRILGKDGASTGSAPGGSYKHG